MSLTMAVPNVAVAQSNTAFEGTYAGVSNSATGTDSACHPFSPMPDQPCTNNRFLHENSTRDVLRFSGQQQRDTEYIGCQPGGRSPIHPKTRQHKTGNPVWTCARDPVWTTK
jgi:hypothetical protein